MPDLHYDHKTFTEYDHQEKLARGVQFTIDYQGRWYNHGGANAGPIHRKSIAALFGGAGKGFMAGKGLRIEDGEYWLRSPDGKYKVEVEDVPFLIKRLEVRHKGQGQQEIDFYTDFDEYVPLNADHKFELRAEPRHNVDVFYIEVRAGLWARLDRNVNNDILQNFIEETSDSEIKDATYTIRSYGCIIDVN